MHKSSVRFRFGSVRQKKLEVRFGSGSAKNSWFGRILVQNLRNRQKFKNLSIQTYSYIVYPP